MTAISCFIGGADSFPHYDQVFLSKIANVTRKNRTPFLVDLSTLQNDEAVFLMHTLFGVLFNFTAIFAIIQAKAHYMVFFSK